uniref:Uncharacterized protein n=1 Tax=Anopheles arabiensis TaxID=7173 RepID=A0A182IHU5_ANOAR
AEVSCGKAKVGCGCVCTSAFACSRKVRRAVRKVKSQPLC